MRVPRELVTVLSERIPAAAAEIHWETGKDVCLQRPLSQETCLSFVQRRPCRLRPRVTGRTLKSGEQKLSADCDCDSCAGFCPPLFVYPPFTDVKRAFLLPRIILFLLYRIGLSRCSGTAGNHSLREGVERRSCFPARRSIFGRCYAGHAPTVCGEGVKKSEV